MWFCVRFFFLARHEKSDEGLLVARYIIKGTCFTASPFLIVIKNLIPNKFKIVMINESFVCLKLKMLERCYPREVPVAFSGSFFGVAQRM